MMVSSALDKLAEMAFGRTKTEAIEKGICVRCGKPKGEFRDAISEKEYEITQMCQVCQDWFFFELESEVE
jgi:uncharacterized CHY-type Zn-finger protein